VDEHIIKVPISIYLLKKFLNCVMNLRFYRLKTTISMVIQKYSSELAKLQTWKENVLIGVKIVAYIFKNLGENT